jgi:hypothetical protein
MNDTIWFILLLTFVLLLIYLLHLLPQPALSLLRISVCTLTIIFVWTSYSGQIIAPGVLLTIFASTGIIKESLALRKYYKSKKPKTEIR